MRFIHMTMTDRMKQQWRDFKKREPGKRFQEIHENRRKGEKDKSPVMRHVRMAAGVLLTLVGVFMLPMPGPGTIVLVLGLAVMAGESVTVAKFLDWLELRLRAVYQSLKKAWEKWSPVQRWSAVSAAALALGGTAGLLLYWLVLK